MHCVSRFIAAGVGVAACSLLASVAIAQTYPAKAIRLILPFPPGGPTDIVGRLTGQKLSEQVGQSVIADSRPGASGNVGLELASKAPPDGYTIVLSSPVISLSPHLYAKLNYDPQKDLAPIALIGALRNVLVVHPSVPARNIKELVQIARKNPGKLNYGSGGVGTTTHLAPELLKHLEKLDIVHVPYKGSGVALIALASGQVDLEVLAVPAALGQIQAGRVRALAVLAPQRAAQLPNLPTSKESGYENFEISVWYGILAPAATPREIINRLNSELNKVIAAPDMKEKMATSGVEPLGGTPEQFRDYIRSESVRFGNVIKAAGIKGE
ncbi:MAG: tripartite tricarboxylate transporter substrate binding protein [Pseudomonadota bacterium]